MLRGLKGSGRALNVVESPSDPEGTFYVLDAGFLKTNAYDATLNPDPEVGAAMLPDAAGLLK